MTGADGQRVKLATCEKREYAEFIKNALTSYKLTSVLEAAQNPMDMDTFKIDPVEVVWKAEK